MTTSTPFINDPAEDISSETDQTYQRYLVLKESPIPPVEDPEFQAQQQQQQQPQQYYQEYQTGFQGNYEAESTGEDTSREMHLTPIPMDDEFAQQGYGAMQAQWNNQYAAAMYQQNEQQQDQQGDDSNNGNYFDMPSESTSTSNSNSRPLSQPVSRQEEDGSGDDDGVYTCLWNHPLRCGQTFTSPKVLFEHVCEAHIGYAKNGNLCLQCHWDDCQTMKKKKRDHILSHVRKHVPAYREFVCDFCGERRQRKHDLTKHLQRAHGVKNGGGETTSSTPNRPSRRRAPAAARPGTASAIPNGRKRRRSSATAEADDDDDDEYVDNSYVAPEQQQQWQNMAVYGYDQQQQQQYEQPQYEQQSEHTHDPHAHAHAHAHAHVGYDYNNPQGEEEEAPLGTVTIWVSGNDVSGEKEAQNNENDARGGNVIGGMAGDVVKSDEEEEEGGDESAGKKRRSMRKRAKTNAKTDTSSSSTAAASNNKKKKSTKSKTVNSSEEYEMTDKNGDVQSQRDQQQQHQQAGFYGPHSGALPGMASFPYGYETPEFRHHMMVASAAAAAAGQPFSAQNFMEFSHTGAPHQQPHQQQYQGGQQQQQQQHQQDPPPYFYLFPEMPDQQQLQHPSGNGQQYPLPYYMPQYPFQMMNGFPMDASSYDTSSNTTSDSTQSSAAHSRHASNSDALPPFTAPRVFPALTTMSIPQDLDALKQDPLYQMYLARFSNMNKPKSETGAETKEMKEAKETNRFAPTPAMSRTTTPITELMTDKPSSSPATKLTGETNRETTKPTTTTSTTSQKLISPPKSSNASPASTSVPAPPPSTSASSTSVSPLPPTTTTTTKSSSASKSPSDSNAIDDINNPNLFDLAMVAEWHLRKMSRSCSPEPKSTEEKNRKKPDRAQSEPPAESTGPFQRIDEDEDESEGGLERAKSQPPEALALFDEEEKEGDSVQEVLKTLKMKLDKVMKEAKIAKISAANK